MFSSQIHDAILAGLGGIARVIFANLKTGASITPFKLFAHTFLAIISVVAVGKIIPADYAYRDGALLAIGFCGYGILDMLEPTIQNFFSKFLPNFVPPVNKQTKDNPPKDDTTQ